MWIVWLSLALSPTCGLVLLVCFFYSSLDSCRLFIRQLSFASFRMENLLFVHCEAVCAFGRTDGPGRMPQSYRRNPNMLTNEFSDFDEKWQNDERAREQKKHTERKKSSEKKLKSFEFDTLFFPLLCQRSMKHCFEIKFRYIYRYLFDVFVDSLHTHIHTVLKLGLFH